MFLEREHGLVDKALLWHLEELHFFPDFDTIFLDDGRQISSLPLTLFLRPTDEKNYIKINAIIIIINYYYCYYYSL